MQKFEDIAFCIQVKLNLKGTWTNNENLRIKKYKKQNNFKTICVKNVKNCVKISAETFYA